ncbi:MAG TPA: VWA domain-containing protein [Pyrinomonadaceae bacterium]|nr:VWA domain-containing protein [Pyrinomonadaceae bacterium]
MKKFTSHLCHIALAGSLCTAAFAQQPAATPAPQLTPTPNAQQPSPTPSDEEVVRITANLVQLDVVVTDKNGNQVTDLQPSDFEILEDGKPQQITHFSYINNEPSAQPAPAPTPREKNAPPPAPVPPVQLRPEQVRRTIALVVDDLGLSFESTAATRTALRKFVEQQMRPNDLVAIIRTSAGAGALQQFTSDRRQLLAAIERIRWNATFNNNVGAFAPLASTSFDKGGGARGDSGAPTESDAETELNNFREDIFAVGTLGALNYVVRGMRALPGRKSVVLLAEGFQLYRSSTNETNNRVLTALQRLTDLANRASVVIYTMDARGLQYTGLTAADDAGGFSQDQLADQLSSRSNRLFETQQGLRYLAQQTGGFAIVNNNDLARGLRKVFADQKGYYLIGYRPSGSTFDRRLHRFGARVVTHKDFRVRTRTGFYGVPDEELRPAPRTPAEQLYVALTSPFASGDVHLRLTALFANDAKAGSFMRALMHIDARDLTFTDEPDGWHKTVVDVMAITFGDFGQMIDHNWRTETLRLRGEAYQQALNAGFIYSYLVPIKKAGAYQLRIAVRDNASTRTGSASQFIEVPDMGKKRLMLSGLVVSGSSVAARPSPAPTPSAPPTDASAGQTAPAKPTAAVPGAGALAEADPLAGPAVRRLHQQTYLNYGYAIYNAQLDKTTGKPQLTIKVQLFRDGQLVFDGQPKQLTITQPDDLRRISVAGRLLLGTDLAPGEYVLQVVVTDALADAKHRTASQWSDLEIVK